MTPSHEMALPLVSKIKQRLPVLNVLDDDNGCNCHFELNYCVGWNGKCLCQSLQCVAEMDY